MSSGWSPSAMPSVFDVVALDEDLASGADPDAPASRQAKLALATASLAFVLASVNVTVTNLAFPDIVASFSGASSAMAGWIISGYALAFASTMLAGGRLADRYGRLLIFQVGLVGLIFGSLAAGLAPNLTVLLIARAVQGICGALAVPSSLALVIALFPSSRQASVIGLWAAAGMSAAGLAPGMAAVILQFGSWRWIYLVLVPIAMIGLVGARRYLRETIEPDLTRPLDLVGMVLGSSSVLFVVLATLQGGSWGWTSPQTMGCFGAAVVLLPVFVARSARHPEPLFDPRLFRIRSFAVANAVATFGMAGAFTSWFLWPVFLSGVWGYDKLTIGMSLTPSPIISAVVAVLGGRWADKHGLRGMMTLAAVIGSLGQLWLWLFLGQEVQFWFAFFPATVMFGIGMGILASHLNSAALRDVPPESMATANGVHQALRYAVGGLGVAVSIAVLGGTNEVDRYTTLWMLLAISQFAIAPLLWFGYPKGRS